MSALPDLASPHGKGDAPPDDDPPAAFFSPAAADSFHHDQHKALACITCHTTTSKASTLNFKPPRGCQICHHTAASKRECTACHAAAQLGPEPVQVTVTVPASGRVVVTLTAGINKPDGLNAFMSFASSGGSGDVGADDARALVFITQGFGYLMASATFVVTDLSPGAHTFTAKYKRTGATASPVFFDNRRILAIPLP